LFYTGSLRKAYEPALQGRDKISMRGLIRGDTEKSTPTLLYKRREFLNKSPLLERGVRGDLEIHPNLPLQRKEIQRKNNKE